MKLFHKNLLLLMLLIGLVATPIFLNKGSSFDGTDDLALQTAASMGADLPQNGGGSPLAKHETLLFALQGSLGAGVIGYYFGYQRGKRVGRK